MKKYGMLVIMFVSLSGIIGILNILFLLYTRNIDIINYIFLLSFVISIGLEVYFINKYVK